jgi:hypothetical protein
MGGDRIAVFARDGEDQARFDQRQFQPVGPLAGVADRLEAVLLDQVEDRDRALMLDVGRGAADRFVQLDVDQPVRVLAACPSGLTVQPDGDGTRMGVEPFAFGKRDGGGRQRASWSAPSFSIEVRFMKSSTDRPEEKRAERAVGSTWLEPPT